MEDLFEKMKVLDKLNTNLYDYWDLTDPIVSQCVSMHELCFETNFDAWRVVLSGGQEIAHCEDFCEDDEDFETFILRKIDEFHTVTLSMCYRKGEK
jgi:hypothetical protein